MRRLTSRIRKSKLLSMASTSGTAIDVRLIARETVGAELIIA
jgi:hypothetical protein